MTFHILPGKDRLALCSVEGTRIEELLRFPIDQSFYDGRSFRRLASTLSVELRILIYAPLKTHRGQQRELRFVELNESFDQILREESVPCPERFIPTCTCLVGRRLFVGGEARADSLIAYLDLDRRPREWTRIQVAALEKCRRKSVDDFLVDGDTLIAVDNVVVPKYLIELTLVDPPTVKAVTKVSEHGTWERIHAASMGSDWIALLSGTGSDGGPGHHLSLLARESRVESAWLEAIPTTYREYVEREHSDALGANRKLARIARYECREWNDIAFCRDRLVIAAGRDGIGILSLAGLAPGSVARDQPYRPSLSSKELQASIAYRPLPGVHASHLDVIDGSRVIVTYDLNGTDAHLVVEV